MKHATGTKTRKRKLTQARNHIIRPRVDIPTKYAHTCIPTAHTYRTDIETHNIDYTDAHAIIHIKHTGTHMQAKNIIENHRRQAYTHMQTNTRVQYARTKNA